MDFDITMIEASISINTCNFLNIPFAPLNENLNYYIQKKRHT